MYFIYEKYFVLLHQFKTTNKTIMKAINKSKLMLRAWYLVKNQGYTLGFAMSKVWKEMKEFIVEKSEQAKRALIPEIQTIAWNPNPESMQEFYNNNEYKGD